MDEKILQRYHDVKQIVNSSSNAGEVKMARQFLNKFESKHPNLPFYYEKWLMNQRKEEEEDQSNPFDWENISSIFDRFVSFTEKAFGVREALSASMRCQFVKRYNSRSVSITVSIPQDLYESWVCDYNSEQQRAFLESLSTNFKNKLKEDIQ